MSATMTLDEAAAFLKTTPETVSAMIHTRGLPAVKVGRAYVLVDDDVVAWLREQYAREDKCASTEETKARRGRSTSGTTASDLDAALARQTGKQPKSGRISAKPNSGARIGSGNVLPLVGTRRS